MKAQDVITLALIGGIGYFVYTHYFADRPIPIPRNELNIFGTGAAVDLNGWRKSLSNIGLPGLTEIVNGMDKAPANLDTAAFTKLAF